MRISLGSRAARACAAALVVSLSAAPSFARTGGVGGASFGRPGFGPGHGFAPRGPNRFGPGRFGPNRFGFNHFGQKPFGRFGYKRFDRFGYNRFGNELLIGGWGWGDWGGYSAPAAASGPIILGGAPVIINVGDPAPPDAAGASSGGCVVHKLDYDANGKYVGERQIPLC